MRISLGNVAKAAFQTVDKLGVGCYIQHHFSFKTSFLFIFFKINKNLAVFQSRFSRIFASFFKFMHAKVSPAFISIRAFPTYCVYRNPCCSLVLIQHFVQYCRHKKKVPFFNCKLFFVLTKLYNRSEHLLFRAVLLMNSGVTDTETIRPENREELILCRI